MILLQRKMLTGIIELDIIQIDFLFPVRLLTSNRLFNVIKFFLTKSALLVDILSVQFLIARKSFMILNLERVKITSRREKI